MNGSLNMRLASSLVLLLGASCSSETSPGSGPDVLRDSGPRDVSPGPDVLLPGEGGRDSGPDPLDAPEVSVPDALSDGPSDAQGKPDASAQTVIRVHYPTGSEALTLRGSALPLNWNSGLNGTRESADVWTFSLPLSSESVEVKPLLSDSTWSRGPNYKIARGTSVDIYPRFRASKGSYSIAFSHSSALLGNKRGIWVYLPPSYAENTSASFPVVYMHDGQNLFDAASAFGGREWQVDEAFDVGAESGTLAEAVVVGVENTSARIDELTPTASPDSSPDSSHPGGKGDLYLRMISEEVLPKIQGTYRVLRGRENTAIAGSSLGGLISSYASVTKGDVFGLAGAFSPSTWWDNRVLLGLVSASADVSKRALRVYVDSGDSGSSQDGMVDTSELAKAYRTLGYQEGATLHYVVQPGGQHNETYWAQRFPAAMTFLLGPRPDLR